MSVGFMSQAPTMVATRALDRMAECFRDKDLEGLLALFSDRDSATYAGSEVGETATGPAALRTLLGDLLNRDATYTFTFGDVRAEQVGDAIWVLAEGTGHETSADATVETFPYRVCGLLVPERRGHCWVLLSGGEPTQSRGVKSPGVV